MPPYQIKIINKDGVIFLETGNGRNILFCPYHDTIGELKKLLDKKHVIFISENGQEMEDFVAINRDIILRMVEYQCTIDKVYYVENIFSDLTLIKDECNKLKDQLVLERTDKVTRKIVSINPTENNIINSIFYGESFLNTLSRLLSLNLKPSSIPIDYRIYEVGGSMEWHRDTIMNNLEHPQIEIVFTLENSSDSRTEWIDDDTKEHHSIWAKPNSIIITQGGGAYHRVLPVTNGFRSIIKIAYFVG